MERLVSCEVALARHVGHSCITFAICVEGWPLSMFVLGVKMVNSARSEGFFFGIKGGETDVENICLQDTSWLAVSNIFLCSPLLGEMIQFDYFFQIG